MKFVVEVGEQAAPLRSLSTTRNAFAIMFADQKQIQQGDYGVPLTIPVKMSKDRLYNDLVHLMKELGVKWINPNAYGALFLKKNCVIHYGILMGIMRQLLNVHQKYPHCSLHYVATIALKSTSIVNEH